MSLVRKPLGDNNHIALISVVFKVIIKTINSFGGWAIPKDASDLTLISIYYKEFGFANFANICTTPSIALNTPLPEVGVSCGVY